MPNQQLPVLELQNGTKMGQSNSILRYLGMKYGYYPEDPIASYKCDMICDEYFDVFQKLYMIFFTPEN